jgi:hypothetical protein
MINPRLTEMLVQAREADVRRGANAAIQRRLAERPVRPPQIAGAITLRIAFPGDDDSLFRLAQLDSTKPPREPVLLAEVAGELRAALSLADGTVVADPFRPTTGLVELLCQRASQLAGGDRPPRSRRLRLWSRLAVRAAAAVR